jgi:negative regulator of flagellin synthesis FlgM
MMDISGKLPPILANQHTQRADASPRVVSSRQTMAAEPTPSAAAGDKVHLSPQVRELQAARSVAAGIPEIREAKVAAIRAQIEAGTYRVDSEKIAGKVLAEALLNAHLK